MRHLTLVPSWLRFLIVVLLTMGILFRFLNLDGKVYSHDEIYTSLRISGYTVDEVREEIFNGRVISGESFRKFQSPRLEKGFSDIIMSLAQEEPLHPPLYYLIARFWVNIFGDSVTAIRSLSALISLLVFPCIYWLCQELFNVPLLLPSIAIAFMSISPIQLVYAQEAREYILWLVAILLSSASLLRAINLELKYQERSSEKQQIADRFSTWGIYFITLTFSLYICLWSGFVAIAHGIYVIAIARFRLTETVRAYLLASVLSFLAFMPWLMIVVGHLFQFLISGDGTKMQASLMPIIPFLLMQTSRIFFDLDFLFNHSLEYLISLFFLILSGYSIYFLCLTSNYRISSFIIVMITIPALPVILPDLLAGSIKSASEPYLIPSYLGIQLAVVYLFTTKIYNGSLSQRAVWQTLMGLIIICGLVSCRVNYQAETWWNKGVSYGNPQVAKIINQAVSPLLISDDEGINFGNIFSLSYILQPQVRFQLSKIQNIPNIADKFTDIFLLNPSNAWREQIATKYKSQTDIVYEDDYYVLCKIVQPLILPQRVTRNRK
jgi:uncharacterized membrane protein